MRDKNMEYGCRKGYSDLNDDPEECVRCKKLDIGLCRIHYSNYTNLQCRFYPEHECCDEDSCSICPDSCISASCYDTGKSIDTLRKNNGVSLGYGDDADLKWEKKNCHFHGCLLAKDKGRCSKWAIWALILVITLNSILVVFLIIGVVIILKCICIEERISHPVQQVSMTGRRTSSARFTLKILVRGVDGIVNGDAVEEDEYNICFRLGGQEKRFQVKGDPLIPEELSFTNVCLGPDEDVIVELWSNPSIHPKTKIGSGLLDNLVCYAVFIKDGIHYTRTVSLLGGDKKTCAEVHVEVWAE